MAKEVTINTILEIRRIINEQYVSILYIDAETEQDEKDLTKLKGLLSGARGVLDTYAERLIKSR